MNETPLNAVKIDRDARGAKFVVWRWTQIRGGKRGWLAIGQYRSLDEAIKNHRGAEVTSEARAWDQSLAGVRRETGGGR